jgi:putative membrane protein
MSEVRDDTPIPALATRSVFGGVLMGLANLVPGVSGGTMLLTSGIYPKFIEAIAELTRLRFRFRSILVLALVVASAGIAIALLAGTVKNLVIDHRWIMYSLFIGLTLGGVPIVWRLARPATAGVWTGAAAGFIGMALLAIAQQMGFGAGSGAHDANMLLLLLAGAAGAAAMILPGVSGGYLLLVLGQYVPILASIDRAKEAALARDMSALLGEARVVIPVGIGVVVGVVVVSNLLRALLERYEKATLGVLLGLLVGAVVGLWPFQAGVQPIAGDVVKGQVLTEESALTVGPEDWPVEYFKPTVTQIGASLALITAGFGATVLIGLIGRDKRQE